VPSRIAHARTQNRYLNVVIVDVKVDALSDVVCLLGLDIRNDACIVRNDGNVVLRDGSDAGFSRFDFFGANFTLANKNL